MIDKYINKIIHGDCLDIMRKLPDKCIDLVLTDPPYNIKKADWDSWANIDDYVNWLGSVFKECQRVLKDNGSFYFFHNDFLQIVELQNYINNNTNFVFKQLIVWDKYNGSKWNQLNAIVHSEQNRNYSKQAEYCLFYTFQDEYGSNCINEIRKYIRNEIIKSKGKINLKDINNVLGTAVNGGGVASACLSLDKTFPAMITEEHYIKLQKWLGIKFLCKEYKDLKNEYEKKRYIYNNQGFSSVLNFPAICQNEHITPKPINLIETLIKHSSNKDSIILDCFSGSGTTAIACHNLNRNFICIEKDYDYWKASCERLANVQAQMRLF